MGKGGAQITSPMRDTAAYEDTVQQIKLYRVDQQRLGVSFHKDAAVIHKVDPIGPAASLLDAGDEIISINGVHPQDGAAAADLLRRATGWMVIEKVPGAPQEHELDFLVNAGAVPKLNLEQRDRLMQEYVQFKQGIATDRPSIPGINQQAAQQGSLTARAALGDDISRLFTQMTDRVRTMVGGGPTAQDQAAVRIQSHWRRVLALYHIHRRLRAIVFIQAHYRGYWDRDYAHYERQYLTAAALIIQKVQRERISEQQLREVRALLKREQEAQAAAVVVAPAANSKGSRTQRIKRSLSWSRKNKSGNGSGSGSSTPSGSTPSGSGNATPAEGGSSPSATPRRGSTGSKPQKKIFRSLSFHRRQRKKHSSNVPQA